MGCHRFLLPRRQFLAATSVCAGAGLLPRAAGATGRSSLPLNLTYFDKPITPEPFPIAFGCAAITWGDPSERAITEISEVGFAGIQLRASVLKEYASPEALAERLAKSRLRLVCYSGGGPSLDPAKRDDEVAAFLKGARFARAAGALFIQATSPQRPTTPDRGYLMAYARLLTEVGKQTADLGLPLALHPHLGQLVETDEETDQVLGAADERAVRYLLDVGHCRGAGGDPAAMVKKHADRLALLHVKDVTRSHDDSKQTTFVELGQGQVDWKAVFAALARVKFRGWGILELDSPGPGRTARAAAASNKKFIETTLGVTV